MVKKIMLIFLISLFTSLSLIYVVSAINKRKVVNNEEFKNESFRLDSPLFSRKHETSDYVQPEIKFLGFKKVLKNEKFELYYRERTGAIRIKNLETNYVWSSDLASYDMKDYFNAFVRSVQSGFELVFRNSEGKAINVRSSDSDLVKMQSEVLKNENKLKVHSEILATVLDEKKVVLSFDYYLTLLDNGFNVTLDSNSIVENFDCKLTEISFFKYFGAVLEESIPGYIFIPNGNGGLINYRKDSSINTFYQTSFYGVDANYNQNKIGNNLNAPIFGMVHGINQNACLVNIKSGDAFAKFNYYPTGLSQTNNFTLSYPSFDLRETYLLKISSGDQVLMIPDNYYENTLSVNYEFLSNDKANYVGMAKAYRNDLIKDGILKKQELKEAPSMHLEAFGSEYEQGLLFKKEHLMTTTKDLVKINEDLAGDYLYTLKGFYKGGFSNSSADNLKFNLKLGKLKDLKDLDYYLYYDPAVSYKEKNKPKSNTLVNMQRNKHYLEVVENQKYGFLTNIKDVKKGVGKAIKTYDKLSFDGITYNLYGDYNNNYTRSDSLLMLSDLFPSSYPMYEPNSYLFKNTKSYLNMPIYHERLKFIKDSVPFMQIVLRGYMDLYSNFLNFSSNHKLDRLKCVEYGMYPSFLVTYEASNKLSNTLSNNLYATEYKRIKKTIKDDYEFISGALKEVMGSTIVKRECFDLGIYKVTYDNGVMIVVNYQDSPYYFDGVLIDPLSYGVIK